MSTYLHNSAVRSASHHNALLFFERHPPNSICWLRELSNKLPGFEIPHLDPTVTASAHNAGIVELQACHAIVMGC